jgi:hypothetical protein
MLFVSKKKQNLGIIYDMAKDGFNPNVFSTSSEAFRHGRTRLLASALKCSQAASLVIRRNPYNVQKHKIRLER